MQSRIKAEFENFDIAESAARLIKNSIDGVFRISVRNKYSKMRGNIYESNVEMSRYLVSGMYNQNRFENAVSMQTDFDDSIYSNDFEIGKEAVVEVICDDETSDQVRSLLVSLGGLSVKKY